MIIIPKVNCIIQLNIVLHGCSPSKLLESDHEDNKPAGVPVDIALIFHVAKSFANQPDGKTFNVPVGNADGWREKVDDGKGWLA